MTTKRKVAGSDADATLPKTPITIDGKTYNLCCDLGALSEAETKINAGLGLSERRVNLLAAMTEENLSNTRILFAASLRVFHPEITFAAGCAMVQRDNLFDIAFTLREAWKQATPEKIANPAEAQPAK